jgi:hypothetical protein
MLHLLKLGVGPDVIIMTSVLKQVTQGLTGVRATVLVERRSGVGDAVVGACEETFWE